MNKKVVIYTDGGASPNPGYGGWAAVLSYKGKEKVLTGNEVDTTNNRMELIAAIRALQALTRPMSVDVYTDSQYLQKGITVWIKNWITKGKLKQGKNLVKNTDLWLELHPLTKYHDVTWHWVRGHSGNVMNERVDRLACEARTKIMPMT